MGCLLRSQPKNKPAINAPPLVLKLMGMPPIWTESAPNKPPTRIPRPTNIISVWLVGRSIYPRRLAAASTSCLVPTTSMTSPASNFVCANTGNFSAGKSRSWASCTSGPIQLSSPMMYSRRPLSTTSSPGSICMFMLTSTTTPDLRRRSTNRRLSCCRK